MTISIQDATFLPLAELLANAQADDLQVRRKLQTPRDRYVKEKTSFYLQTLKQRFSDWQTRLSEGEMLLQEKLNVLPFDKKKPFIQNIAEILSGKQYPAEEFLIWIYQEAYEHYTERDWDKAYALFQVLVALAPFSSDYWTSLGFIQRQLEQTAGALSSFSLAVLLNPGNLIARYQLAELYCAQKQYTEALHEIDILSGAVKDTPLEAEVKALESKIITNQRGR